MDSRIKKLASGLVNYSSGVKEAHNVYIHHNAKDTKDLARQLVKEVYAAKGIPFVHYTEPQVQREVLLHATKEQMELMAEVDSLEMSKMDCYIGEKISHATTFNRQKTSPRLFRGVANSKIKGSIKGKR